MIEFHIMHNDSMHLKTLAIVISDIVENIAGHSAEERVYLGSLLDGG